MEKGFGVKLYSELQTEKILERIAEFDNKLYLEFGGKLFDDMHAYRVLPGFEYNAKMNIVRKLKDRAEIIFVISARDIERNKIRADFGITYDMDVLRLIDKIRKMGIYMNSVVVTQYCGQSSADVFLNKLIRRGEKTYVHTVTKGYPTDIDTIVSDEGYGANSYIETTRPLVVVTAPGPGSGKLATCLSQLYHEYKRGVKAGYAKFETFPVWNLPLRHPVNIAYEAATADLGDTNMIDPYHLEAYGVSAVNYNRDISCFPIVRSILSKITGEDFYRSPTDMGVNMTGFAITDDKIVRNAARQEIIRRYFKTACEYKQGICAVSAVQRVKLLMNENEISVEERRVVAPALKKAEKAKVPCAAIELPDGNIVAGKTTSLMTNCSSAILNAVKTMANIDDKELLLSPEILEPITALKKEVLCGDKVKLNLADVLTALSICARQDGKVKKAYDELTNLKDCEAHSTCMLPQIDLRMLRKLGINITCEPEFPSKDLYGV